MATKKDRDKKKARQEKAKRQYNANKNKKNKFSRTSKTAGGLKAERAAYNKQKAKDMAKARIEAGISVSDTVKANKQAVRDFARNQHTKFKQTGVATHGGTRSSDSYSTKEKKRITDAGYSTKSYGTDKARSNTDVQVSRDNARYGNTFPAGAFSPSKPAYSQAEQPTFKEGQLVAGTTKYGLRPDGVTGEYKKGDIFNTGGLKGKDFMYDGKTWKQVQNLPGQEVGKFAAADLSGMQIGSMPTQQVPTRTYGYPSQQEVDDAIAQSTAGFIPSSSLNINKPTTEETANPLSRTLQIKALGALDALTGNLGDFDGLGGQTEFGQQLGDSINAAKTIASDLGDLSGQSLGPVDTVKSLANFAVDNQRDLMNLAQNKQLSLQDVADATTYARNIKDLGPLQATANLSSDEAQGIGESFNFAKNTDLYNEALTNFGGPRFPTAVNQFADYVGENFNKLTDDVAANRRVLSDMMIGNDPRLDPAKAIAYQYQDNVNPNLRNLGIQGFKTAVNAAMQPNANKIAGLNKDERGLIGSLGNWRLSNLGQNIVTDNLSGTPNALGLASNILSSGSDPTSSTYKDSQRFLRTIGTGGPTPSSLIRGIVPGKSRSSAGAFGRGFLSRLPNATTTPQEVVEFIQDTLPSEVIPEFTDPTDAYDATLNQYLTNPNYFPEVQQYTPPVRTSFKQTFNRDYY